MGVRKEGVSGRETRRPRTKSRGRASERLLCKHSHTLRLWEDVGSISVWKGQPLSRCRCRLETKSGSEPEARTHWERGSPVFGPWIVGEESQRQRQHVRCVSVPLSLNPFFVLCASAFKAQSMITRRR